MVLTSAFQETRKKKLIHSGNFDSIWQKQTDLNKKGTAMKRKSKWVTARSSLFLLTQQLQVTKSHWYLVRRPLHFRICSVTRIAKGFPGTWDLHMEFHNGFHKFFCTLPCSARYFASKPPFAFLGCMAHEAGSLVPVAGVNF